VDFHLIAFGAAIVGNLGAEGVGAGGGDPALEPERSEHLRLTDTLVRQAGDGQEAKNKQQPVKVHSELLTENLN
jgi:hypothetical protein